MVKHPQTDDPFIGEMVRRLPRKSAPEDLWSRVAGKLRESDRIDGARVKRHPVRAPVLAVAAVLTGLLGGSVVGVYLQYRSPATWSVVPLSGVPSVGSSALSGPADLGAGEWLVTDSTSRAVMDVGSIGTVEVGPNTMVRMEHDGTLAHRLMLERGSLSAVIAAPPRLFFVRTPTVLATDLGCAYTLRVDEDGATHIHVTVGWVELEQDGRVAIVPAGLVAEVEAGQGPGTPYPLWLSDESRDALHRIDRNTGTAADLQLVLDDLRTTVPSITLRKERAVTLWHLLQRVDRTQRSVVYDQLQRTSPAPAGVTREGILTLDRPMMERWRRDLSPLWSEEAQPLHVKLIRRLWSWAID